MLKDAPMFAYVPVSDVPRARRFYEDMLGFEVKAELGGGAFYDSAQGTGFFLYPSAGAGTSKASTAFWRVTDVVATVSELRARGIVFEEYDSPNFRTVDGIATGGGAMTAWFKDSEGNILAITQSL